MTATSYLPTPLPTSLLSHCAFIPILSRHIARISIDNLSYRCLLVSVGSMEFLESVLCHMHMTEFRIILLEPSSFANITNIIGGRSNHLQTLKQDMILAQR